MIGDVEEQIWQQIYEIIYNAADNAYKGNITYENLQNIIEDIFQIIYEKNGRVLFYKNVRKPQYDYDVITLGIPHYNTGLKIKFYKYTGMYKTDGSIKIVRFTDYVSDTNTPDNEFTLGLFQIIPDIIKVNDIIKLNLKMSLTELLQSIKSQEILCWLALNGVEI